MARKPSPWYWPERHGWYTILGGQRRHLVDLHPDVPPPKKRNGKWVAPPEVEKLFFALLAAPPENSEQKTTVPTISPSGGPTVPEILDKYLDWCQKHRALRTYDWYHDHIQSFLTSLAEPGMAVADLKPFHVIEWADQHPDWSPAYRRGAIVAIQRPFNWAEELGYIPQSPIKKIKKPQPQRRESHASPADFTKLMERFPEGDPFRDLLVFAWHAGCRPQETRHIEARHVQLASECVVLPKEESKGKRRARVILLHGPALEIVKRLMALHPEGKLFLNKAGRPWKRFAIANRFDRLHLALGIEALKEAGIAVPKLPRFNRRQFTNRAQLIAARKEHQQKLCDRRKQILKLARQHGKKLAAYDLRHGFAQRMLESGTNHLAVAELMGHSTGRMVAETYSHMNKATAHLKEALKKADEGA